MSSTSCWTGASCSRAGWNSRSSSSAAGSTASVRRPRSDMKTDVARLDVARIRTDFPLLQQEHNGHRLVYLDSASSAQKPRSVVRAMDDVMERYYANVHRGVYAIAEESTARFEAARAKVAAFIGARESAELIFTRNATEAINLVAYSWGRANLAAGDVVVLSEMEHHANIIPWHMLA